MRLFYVQFLLIIVDSLVLFYQMFYPFLHKQEKNGMKIPSINVVFNRKNLVNKQNKVSVYLRITIDRTSKYVLIPTPEKITPNDWDWDNNGISYVKNSNYFAFEINEKIREFKNRQMILLKDIIIKTNQSTLTM